MKTLIQSIGSGVEYDLSSVFNWVCWIAPDNLVSAPPPDAVPDIDLASDRQPDIWVSTSHPEKFPPHSRFLAFAEALAFLSLPSIGMKLLISGARKLVFTSFTPQALTVFSRLVTPCTQHNVSLYHSNPGMQGGLKQTSLRDSYYSFVSIFYQAALRTSNVSFHRGCDSYHLRTCPVAL